MSEETIAYERYLVYTFLAGIHASVGVSLLSLSLFADSLYLSHSCARSNNFLLQCGVFVKKTSFWYFLYFFQRESIFLFRFFFIRSVLLCRCIWSNVVLVLSLSRFSIYFGVLKLHLLRILIWIFNFYYVR